MPQRWVVSAIPIATQGMSRKQFEAIRPDFGRMHAASTDGSVFAVALTTQADEEGAIAAKTCAAMTTAGRHLLAVSNLQHVD